MVTGCRGISSGIDAGVQEHLTTKFAKKIRKEVLLTQKLLLRAAINTLKLVIPSAGLSRQESAVCRQRGKADFSLRSK
jgi:hypothetical protein